MMSITVNLTGNLIGYVIGGAPWLITLRILEGVGEGTTFPALNTLLAAWIPMKGEIKD